MVLEDIFNNLQSLGFYQYVLPFLLIFTILFAILEKTRIFGTEPGTGATRKNINFVLALVIALIVIVQTRIVEIMTIYLSKMALFILIAVIFFLAIGIFGTNPEQGFTGWPLIVGVLLTVLMTLWALNPDLGSFGFPSWFSPTNYDKAVLVGIGAFLIVLFLVFGRSNNPQGGGFAREIERGLLGRPPH